MKKPILISFLIIVFFFFIGQMAFSEEVTTPDPDPAIGDDTTTETEPSGSRFYSRVLLTETLLSGQPPAPEEPDDTGTGDEEPGDTGTGDEGTTEPTSEGRVGAFVESLSDEQVFAFNRSLNNAVRSQLYSEIIYDLDLLESLDVENLTKQDINAVTKALEEEAKFTKLAEKTGNDMFLDKAETQKAKFLAKAGIEWPEGDTGSGDEDQTTGEGDTTGAGDDEGGDTGGGATDSTLTASVADIEGTAALAAKVARKEAKMAASKAKKAAKLDAKKAVKFAAKKDARKEAKMAAVKDAKKQSKGNKGKGKGKGKKK